MTRLGSSAAVLALVATLAACGSGGSAGGSSTPAGGGSSTVSTASTAAPSSSHASGGTSNGVANMTFTGAVTGTLTNAPATCVNYYPSLHRGAAYTVTPPGGGSMQIYDSEGDGRTGIIFNAPHISYTTRTDNPGVVVVKLDLSGARVDADVRNVVGPQTVHVSGTIQCNGATGPVSGPTTASGANLTHPCELITTDEVKNVIYADVTADDQGFQCRYNSASGWVNLEPMLASSQAATTIFNEFKSTGTAKSGVGDEAYVLGGAIVAKSGTFIVEVDANNFNGGGVNQTQLGTLANIAISRIKAR